MMRFCALAAVTLLAACSPQGGTETQVANAAAAQAVHPISGLEIIPLTVTSRSGKHDFRVEVAASTQEQARGLMFRTQLGPDEGMIFPRQGNAQASFWMKDTPLPLDIIFIGPDSRISNIAAMTTPYSLDSVTSIGPASAVLELAGGRAEELGIEAGDLVEY